MKKLLTLLYIGLVLATPAFADGNPRDLNPWTQMDQEARDWYRVEIFVMFPEILTDQSEAKFAEINQWMLSERGTDNPNIKRIFAEFENKPYQWRGKAYVLPDVYVALLENAQKIRDYLGKDLGPWLEKAKAHADLKDIDIDAMIDDAFAAK